MPRLDLCPSRLSRQRSPLLPEKGNQAATAPGGVHFRRGAVGAAGSQDPIQGGSFRRSGQPVPRKPRAWLIKKECSRRHGVGPDVTSAGFATKLMRNQTRNCPMLCRRSLLLASLIAGTLTVAPALATEAPAFVAQAFADAQKAGKPILIAIHASWCPTCKAQRPILSELRADPTFRDLVYFVIDFDSQKDLVK